MFREPFPVSCGIVSDKQDGPPIIADSYGSDPEG